MGDPEVDKQKLKTIIVEIKAFGWCTQHQLLAFPCFKKAKLAIYAG
jgi:hypothetical protein